MLLVAAAAGVVAVHVLCAGVQGFVLVGRRRNGEGAFFRRACVQEERPKENIIIIMSPLRQRTPYYSVAT